jgi:hypothetical protein
MSRLLTEEQVAYLNSLDSKKKKRKFMLDCLVEKFSEPSLGESKKIVTKKMPTYWLYKGEKFNSLEEALESDVFKIDLPTVTYEETKEKFNINQREVSEQALNLCTPTGNAFIDAINSKRAVELLKFDKLEDMNEDLYRLNLIDFNEEIIKFIIAEKDPTPLLNNYLLFIQKFYYSKTNEKIDFINELFPQLKNNEIAK